MRIVIDMQRAQRALMQPQQLEDFGLKLAQCLVSTRAGHEIVLLLSDFHADSILPMRELFGSALGQEGLRIWYAAACRDLSPDPSNWRLACARLIKEAAIVCLKPDVFIQPIGLSGAAMDLSHMPVFPRQIPTLAVIELGPDAPGDGASDPHLLKQWGFSGGAEAGADGQPAQGASRHAFIDVAVSQLARRAEPDETCAGQLGATGPNCADSIWKAAAGMVRTPFDESNLPHDLAKPRLAYVSPLPPGRSGIADYSATLIPALSRFYHVDVIADQVTTTDPWIAEHCPVNAPDWFRQNHSRYQRVLYHFGNSKFHDYMFDLLAEVPGVVVLHDFFLGDIQLLRELEGLSPHAWTRELYAAQGYGAVVQRFDDSKKWKTSKTLSSYPANLEVLQQAQGVIVHSEYARRLADQFYGNTFPVEWAVIPLVRPPQPAPSRAMARKKLGLEADDFVVCSAGYINGTKLHDRIVQAWSQSRLAQDPHCRLLFVGGADDLHGASLTAATQAVALGGRVRITGWVDGPVYHDYLAAADVAVQLRMQSRGETSAAVLDCMSHSLATIVNANGSMADLPQDAVWRLPDQFTDAQLVDALETLWGHPETRAQIGSRARRLIEQHHAPEVCALQYAAAIENFVALARVSTSCVAQTLGGAVGVDATDQDLATLALGLTRSVPVAAVGRQLLVDVSAIVRTDLKTGIQRVVRALVWELIQTPPPGFRIEPVYLSSEGNAWHYRYARSWTCALLGIPAGWAEDDAAEYGPGDGLLVADFTSVYMVQAQRAGIFAAMRNAGVRVTFTVYDLLPIHMPQMFPPGIGQTHQAWFAAAASGADAAVCISQAVAQEVADYLEVIAPQRSRPLKVDWFHLGANLERSAPTGGLPEGASQVLAALAARPSFLMVGTVEPRKGHAQTLAAFEKLWGRKQDLNLVIVGKQGWMVDALCRRMRDHPESGKRLFWMEGASDEYLQTLYGACLCLIAASEGEGFGLPLIEAAQHGLPIIARDIPVFREVAGEFASYFRGNEDAIADSVEGWLQRWATGNVPQPDALPWLTWRQSAQQLLRCLQLHDRADAPEAGVVRRQQAEPEREAY